MDNRALTIISAICLLSSGWLLFATGKKAEKANDASVLPTIPVALAKPIYGKGTGLPLVRCKGTTKKGVRCRRQGYFRNSYCYQHQLL